MEDGSLSCGYRKLTVAKGIWAPLRNESEEGRAVVELHGRVGFSRKSEKGGADLLMPDINKLEMLRDWCLDLCSVDRDSVTGSLIAVLSFRDQEAAMMSVSRLWYLRLQGAHGWTPELLSPTEEMRLEREVGEAFQDRMRELYNGKSVRERVDAAAELLKTSHGLMKTPQTRGRRRKFFTLKEYEIKRGAVRDLKFRRDQALMTITEFRDALTCLKHIVAGWKRVQRPTSSKFMLGPKWTWPQLQCILERESERFDAHLPLYASRSDILSEIDKNQVTILVGETGSGKSTQLVQYLADAGYAAAGKSIVCTQPRKVSATLLCERVKEECNGCQQSSFPVGCVISSAQSHSRMAEITFTTDSVLLQLCLSDAVLSKFSCVIVDEAHERSLNTDLLLPLLKTCMLKRPDLKVIIMSATVDTDLLSAYFGSTNILRVPGRNFPVQIIFEPEGSSAEWRTNEMKDTSYVDRVVKKVLAVLDEYKDGNILAFLTSPAEVEWACEQHFGASALALPLHGKLQKEDLQRVFQRNLTRKRKIVFATNFGETSLTIPDVKVVVDCGLAKDSMYDPKTGMNVLGVGRIDQSSAIQRAGRAGRTSAGVCYRLYSESDFLKMTPHRVSEIKRVHLGVAMLKLIAMGIKEPNKFEFVEAPDSEAITVALRSLDQLGAVDKSLGSLTGLGSKLVKLGIEPRLGKIVLDSIQEGHGQDGLVIVALMSNGSNVFFRSGSDEAKDRADRLKMRFCHPHGDLFTLLAVYQEWDSIHERNRNKWCVENSISAKALRKCRDQVNEMRACIKYELNLNVTSSWGWSRLDALEKSTTLRKIIFSALGMNLAVFSGHDRVGYDVVSLEQQAYLHPSSAVLVHGSRPEFLVFWAILHTTGTFLVLVTVVDPGWIQSIGYDLGVLGNSKMDSWVVHMTCSSLLTRVCGKQGRNLGHLTHKIQEQLNQRCIIEYSFEDNTLVVYTTKAQMEVAKCLVSKCIETERQWMDNECVEKLIVPKPCKSIPSPSLLFGAGGSIRDVLMPGDFAAIEVMYESSTRLDEGGDDELLTLFDQCGDGISGYDKFPPTPGRERVDQVGQQQHKWGIIRFCSAAAAETALELLNGACVKNTAQLSLRAFMGSNMNSFNRASFPAVKTTLAWARRRRKGQATVTCLPGDAEKVLAACQGNIVCGSFVSAKHDRSKPNAIFLKSLDVNVDERTLQNDLFELSGCRVLDVYMPRLPAPSLQPSVTEVHQMLTREITLFVPTDKFDVVVFEPKEKDYVARAEIRFEESVHEGGTVSLVHLDGLALQGFESWQKISYQRIFSTQVHCYRLVFAVVKEDLEDLFVALQQQYPGTKLVISDKESGSHRVRICGSTIAVVAGCKSAIEKVMEGQAVVDDNLGESTLRLLFTKKGAQMAKAVEVQTRTLVICDKRTRVAKIYGPKEKKTAALEKLLSGLARLHSDVKCRQVVLRGEGIPFGLMREIVNRYGHDLLGLRELAGPGINIKIDHRGHLLSVEGGSMDAVGKVQQAVAEVAHSLGSQGQPSTMEDLLTQWKQGSGTTDNECSICFCPREDQHFLEGCGHGFCRSCLIDQVNSSIRHRDGFPLTCAYAGCSQLFLLTDIRVLLTVEQQEELQSASLSTFVGQSQGKYRFCATPDCPNVYRISTDARHSFVCAACSVQLCTACHVEYHEDVSCAQYHQYKLDPDASLHAWRKGKEKDVKNCPGCISVIEKVDGCNHMICKCGKHVCWVCLSTFEDPSMCYDHLRKLHGGIDGDMDGMEGLLDYRE